jgi:hypothetical protein
MAIGSQQAAIRALIATALSEHISESGQSVDALVAMRQAEAIVKALELAGYETKSKTWIEDPFPRTYQVNGPARGSSFRGQK